MRESVILFPSTNCVMKADRRMSDAGMHHVIAPIPKHLSSDCGYCIKISTSDEKKALDILGRSEITHNGIFGL